MDEQSPLRSRLRNRILRMIYSVLDGLIWLATHMGLWRRDAAAERARYRVIPDVSYVDRAAHREQRLDIYQPRHASGPLPVIMYVHGGGFNQCSRKTHVSAGHALASRGYLVFMVDYRRAPEQPYPSAPHDVSMAYLWITRHAKDYGGDIGRLHVAGESAGGNLVCSIMIGACYQRPEPWMQRIWNTGVVPLSWHPLCAYLKVTEPGRYAYWRERGLMGRIAFNLVRTFARGYLGERHESVDDSTLLADPVRFFHVCPSPDRALPPVMLSVGEWDVIRRDTTQMQAVLEDMNVEPVARYYPGQLHGFQLMLHLPQARDFWQHYQQFLDTTESASGMATRPPSTTAIPNRGLTASAPAAG